MIILGLTGSIGMGKSETARMFRRLGVPVYDADATVHRVYAKGGDAVEPIGKAFPGTIRNGAVDRAALSKAVVGNDAEMRRLERITHPLLRRYQKRFLQAALAKRLPLVVLDIPLLFETGGTKRVDRVAVVSAPHVVQRARVLRRPDMTPEKFAYINRRQTPDKVKRARADFLIPTGLGKRFALDAVRRTIRKAKRVAPKRRRVI
ncbi:dephospho-CoA kinase [Desertibaculum subflavum]|uniref:dephospho-CoA kinase n=1 Tax=Desertibaculum subflavum TaxID=2268458 RepID=UPI000E663651